MHKTILCSLLLVLPIDAGIAQEEDRLAIELEAAIRTETIDGDLDAAIEQYRRLADSGNREIAARALRHLGQVYESMGDAEARRAYERVITEYADQLEQAAAARERLAALPEEADAGTEASVDSDLVFEGEVRRGDFVHEVTAAGALYAPAIRSVANKTEGVVERIYVLPGQAVEADAVLMELSSPDLQQELADAQAELQFALADEELRLVNADDEFLTLQIALADAEDQLSEADRADTSQRRLDIARMRVDRYPERRAAEDAQARVRLDQQYRKLERLEQRVLDLEVRAEVAGVVQEIAVEEGQRLGNGTEVARVINPERLIARVRVSERDAALVEPGQAVRLEMGREAIVGEVMRIDPAVRERLVTVDVELTDTPDRQLRPDQTVIARIEVDRVADTLIVVRPTNLRDGQERAELFRLREDGRSAEKVSVELGRKSASEVEILSGL